MNAETELEEEQQLIRDNVLNCIQCGAPVPDAVCGRKQPCSSCGFPYPIGDCSDLAEN